MPKPRRSYPFRHQRKSRRPMRGKTYKTILRPGIDTKLKKVFAHIGTPDPAPFRPDRFQIQALDLVQEVDCLVTAPTGAGKTWIALEAIAKVLEANGCVWYASPLKALTNAKLTEMSQMFGSERVGILTGDRKENVDAPIIVGTTEILRNQLYDAMHHGQTLATNFVVLDEAHYLGDADRGVVWEETMIYLPQRIPLLLLSATVGNAAEIAAWLSTIRNKPCQVVQETKRPVPLHSLFLQASGTLQPLLVSGGTNAKARIYKKVADTINARRISYLAPPNRLPPFGQILKVLRKYNLLPAIFFLKSRADCDAALQLCQENQIQNPEKAETLSQRMAELINQFGHLRRHRQRWPLEHMAVGSHHSGQIPAWKQVLETLMSEGLLDAIFATSTVAAGVDFPARTVAFLNSDRFNGREFMPLSATELHQMTGRAGRRGKDKIGFVLVVPGKYMDVRQVARLLKSRPGPVYSQIRINFSLTLNILLSHTPDEVKQLLQRSFAAFQRQKSGETKAQTAHALLWQDFERHLEFLQNTGFADPQGRLTADGQWASQLRIDQPLLVAEGLRLDLFPQNNPILLAAVMASMVNEKLTDEHLDKSSLPKSLVSTVRKVDKGLHTFAQYMTICGFETRPLYLRPAAAVWTWGKGSPWDKTVQISHMAEGDLAMLVLRTADNLRHLTALKHVFAQTAKTARQAIDLILRDPVIPEQQVIQETK